MIQKDTTSAAILTLEFDIRYAVTRAVDRSCLASWIVLTFNNFRNVSNTCSWWYLPAIS